MKWHLFTPEDESTYPICGFPVLLSVMPNEDVISGYRWSNVGKKFVKGDESISERCYYAYVTSIPTSHIPHTVWKCCSKFRCCEHEDDGYCLKKSHYCKFAAEQTEYEVVTKTTHSM